MAKLLDRLETVPRDSWMDAAEHMLDDNEPSATKESRRPSTPSAVLAPVAKPKKYSRIERALNKTSRGSISLSYDAGKPDRTRVLALV